LRATRQFVAAFLAHLVHWLTQQKHSPRCA
jgi:hypothetical protein